jgi:YD repeat-containing protein
VPKAGNDIIYPSGDLSMRDGSRYRIDNGTVSWLRDRNGNKMTFTYDSFKRMTVAKDSLNREITVTYSTPSVAYDEISYKGFGGAARTIRVNLQTSRIQVHYGPVTPYKLINNSFPAWARLARARTTRRSSAQ